MKTAGIDVGLTDRTLLVGVLIVWVAIQVAFAPSAFRVDDTNIVRIAEQIARNPSDPYGFRINWGGIDEDAFFILANPPLVPAWLALWGRLAGWTETILHVSMIPFSVMGIVSFFRLARELGTDPRVASLLLVVSPAFLLASQVVMPDIAAVGLSMAAVAGAFTYRRTGSSLALFGSVLTGALAPVAKYNGVLIVAALGSLWLVSPGRRRGLFFAAVAPLASLGLWSLWCFHQYGRAHILTIAEFESEGIVNILSAVLGYFGIGVLPLAVAFMKSPAPQWQRVLDMVSLLTFVMIAASAMTILSIGPFAAAGYSLSATVAFRFAIVAVLRGTGAVREANMNVLVLLAWLAVGVWFQFGLLFASVRYLLPLLPPALLLLLTLESPIRPTMNRGSLWAIALCGILALFVAVGDARTANLYPRFIREYAVPARDRASGRFFFDGHWGFQYYAEKEGGLAINYYRQPRWQVGDVLIIARNPFPSYNQPTPTREVGFTSTEVLLSPGWPVRTIDCAAYANFYGPGVRSCRGPVLPFGFALGPSDEFVVFEARPRRRPNGR